jgi:hypothetical protein
MTAYGNGLPNTSLSPTLCANVIYIELAVVPARGNFARSAG